MRLFRTEWRVLATPLNWNNEFCQANNGNGRQKQDFV